MIDAMELRVINKTKDSGGSKTVATVASAPAASVLGAACQEFRIPMDPRLGEWYNGIPHRAGLNVVLLYFFSQAIRSFFFIFLLMETFSEHCCMRLLLAFFSPSSVSRERLSFFAPSFACICTSAKNADTAVSVGRDTAISHFNWLLVESGKLWPRNSGHHWTDLR